MANDADCLQTQIQIILQETFQPQYLEVIDEGDLHIGHQHEGSGHFAVIIHAHIFTDKNLLTCHRMIYAALDPIMKQIHALRIQIIK